MRSLRRWWARFWDWCRGDSGSWVHGTVLWVEHFPHNYLLHCGAAGAVVVPIDLCTYLPRPGDHVRFLPRPLRRTTSAAGIASAPHETDAHRLLYRALLLNDTVLFWDTL